MKTAVIEKTYRFEAAHYLPLHQGKCRHLHGHSYELRVAVTGPVKPSPQHQSYTGQTPAYLIGGYKPDAGMVMDFYELGQIVKPLVDQLDHQFLNDHIDYPTAENIGIWFLDRIDPEIIRPCRVEFVFVAETKDGGCYVYNS